MFELATYVSLSELVDPGFSFVLGDLRLRTRNPWCFPRSSKPALPSLLANKCDIKPQQIINNTNSRSLLFSDKQCRRTKVKEIYVHVE